MKTDNRYNKKDKTPVTDPNYWDCECEEKYIHHKSARKECTKCGTFHEDQPDSRVDEIANQDNIGTDTFEIKVKWKAVAPMLILALQDPTKSEEDVEWAKSEIYKMAEWIDWAQPELKKLSEVETLFLNHGPNALAKVILPEDSDGGEAGGGDDPFGKRINFS